MEKCTVCGEYKEPWEMNSFGKGAVCNECVEHLDDEDLDYGEYQEE